MLSSGNKSHMFPSVQTRPTAVRFPFPRSTMAPWRHNPHPRVGTATRGGNDSATRPEEAR